jgi:Kdo2-lipid IVA lauroyltransferase/acyltransferase
VLKEIRWYLETALFLAISFAVALLPHRVALAFGPWLGRVFFALLSRRRQVAIDNITQSLPFLESQPGWPGGSAHSIARETFENLGRSLVEVCKIYQGRGRHLIDAVEFRGLEHYRDAVAKGKGVAVITAHCGNWELLALSFGARYHHVSSVARRQDNPHLNRITERIRNVYGNGIIYREGALRAMFAAFKRQEMVGMLIDQAAHPDEGILVDFIGRPAWTTRLPALIARKSGAALLPAFIHREGDKNIVTIHPAYRASQAEDPEVCATEDAQGLTRYIEQYVIEHPTQWYWIHKRWKRAPAASAACTGSEGERNAS